MEKGAILRLSAANFITVGILSAAAYFGVLGAKYAVSKYQQTKGAA